MESVRHKWHLLARHSCPRASIQSTSLAIQRRGMLLPLAAGLVWGRSANEITRLELAHPHPTLPPRLRGKGLVQRATTVTAVEKLLARRLSMCGSRQVIACEAADFVRNRLPRQSLEKSVGPRFDWRRPQGTFGPSIQLGNLRRQLSSIAAAIRRLIEHSIRPFDRHVFLSNCFIHVTGKGL